MRTTLSGLASGAGVSDAEIEDSLWHSVNELPEAVIVVSITVENGVPAVLVDGAPRAVHIIPRDALVSADAETLRTSLGVRLVAFAERLQFWLETPRRTPVLVAVAAGGGSVKVTGDASVNDALRQISQFNAKTSGPPGPMTATFFR